MKANIVTGSLILMMAHVGLGADLYVSPTGKDSNPGTKEQPLATLVGARDAVRKINKNTKSDIVVDFADGVYPIGEPVVFGPQDSGAGGHKVIYTASAGAKPVLAGGPSVTGWEIHDKAKNIYRARTRATAFRQLYVNDVMAIRARHPNRESTKDNSPYWECKIPMIPRMRIKEEHWQLCEKLPAAKLSEVEMVMVCHWYHQRVKIGTVRKDGKEVEIAPAEPNNNFSKDPGFYRKNGSIDNPFYFENALEFIDAPYEWYQDAGNGIVYIAFPKGIKPGEVRVEIPLTETLVSIEGTAANPVRDIEFRGLTFKLTNWNMPSEFGINMTQAAQPIKSEAPPAMVSAKHGERLAFRNNAFLQSGGQGLELYNADLTDIEGNTFRTIAANGIIIDKGTGSNPPPDKQSVGIAIWNNEASACGSHYSNGMFLFASNVRKLTVAHNHIHDLPYSAMQIGQQPGGERGKEFRDVGCGENTIINNLIHHCTQIHGDGGGIYTLGGIQTGTVISGNFIHDTNQPMWDRYHVSHIYLDNNSSKITVKDNVTKGGKAEARNGSKDNIFSNNTEANPQIEKNAGRLPGYNPRAAARSAQE